MMYPSFNLDLNTQEYLQHLVRTEYPNLHVNTIIPVSRILRHDDNSVDKLYYGFLHINIDGDVSVPIYVKANGQDIYVQSGVPILFNNITPSGEDIFFTGFLIQVDNPTYTPQTGTPSFETPTPSGLLGSNIYVIKNHLNTGDTFVMVPSISPPTQNIRKQVGAYNTTSSPISGTPQVLGFLIPDNYQGQLSIFAKNTGQAETLQQTVSLRHSRVPITIKNVSETSINVDIYLNPNNANLSYCDGFKYKLIYYESDGITVDSETSVITLTTSTSQQNYNISKLNHPHKTVLECYPINTGFDTVSMGGFQIEL